MKLTEKQIARLHGLTNAHGQITPSAVVADAKRKDSPLHKLFDWDIKRAANKFWTLRARQIIGMVTVVTTTTEAIVRTPFYVKDTTVKGEGYRTVTALRADPIQARASMIYTLEVAAGHLRRAYDLAQPLGLTNEVDALLEKITGLQRALKSAAA